MKKILMLMFAGASLALTANAQKRNDLNSSEYNGTANSTTGISTYATPTDYKKTPINQSDLPPTVINSYNKTYESIPISEVYAYPFYWDNQAQYFDFHSNSDTVDYSNWNNVNPEYYELVYKKDGRTYKSTYAKDGTLMNTNKIIKDSELPVAVGKAFRNSEYKNWDIVDEKEKVDRKNPDVTIYKIKVKRGEDIHVLHYYQDGKIVTSKNPKNK
jgi:hypothetical protein